MAGITIEVRPATVFADLASMLGPNRADATVCWCRSYRLRSKENSSLRGTERADKVAELVREGPPGVLACDCGQVVGGAAVPPMAYVGTRHPFEKVGFTKAADTTSVLNGFPRVLMRLNLD